MKTNSAAEGPMISNSIGLRPVPCDPDSLATRIVYKPRYSIVCHC